jgi:hypothetical protein
MVHKNTLILVFFQVCLLFVFLSSSGQGLFKIYGKVYDEGSHEPIVGAILELKGSSAGNSTDSQGSYSIKTHGGRIELIVSYLGYKNFEKILEVSNDTLIDLQLEPREISIQEIVVTRKRSDENVRSNSMGVVALSSKELKNLPVLLGEQDVLKSIQLMPGIKSAGEGSSGFFVRGGEADQNLIMYDEAQLYDPSHLLGFMSIFNSDAVSDVQLIKAGMPARYGGRIASVLEVTGMEGDYEKNQINGGVGLIASHLCAQGPIKKDKSSFILSARRTYMDLLIRPIIKPFVKQSSNFYRGTRYYFYDLNGKLTFNPTSKDKVSLSYYYGRDFHTMEKGSPDFTSEIQWGNSALSLQWLHRFNDDFRFKQSMIITNYNFGLDFNQNGNNFNISTNLRDYNYKLDIDFKRLKKHDLKVGINYFFHDFIPGRINIDAPDMGLKSNSSNELYSHELSAYLSDDLEIGEKISIHGGLRFTSFYQVGPYDRYVNNRAGYITDTIHYKTNEVIKNYNYFEPRFNVRYMLSPTSSLKASYTKNYQYLHLVSMSSIVFPTDIWVPSSYAIKPQYGIQYSLGYYKNLKNNQFETSVEVYYKDFYHLIELQEGLLKKYNNLTVDESAFTGEGRSYGVELLLKKNTGKTKGWLSYTLSKTTRQFDSVNGGREYVAKYDRRHDLSVVVNHQLNEKITFSAVFVYASGNAMTIPVSWYVIQGNIAYEYGPRNGFRMPAYHRLDLSMTYNVKKKGRYESSWIFSVYNVYNHQNPYFIYFDATGDLDKGKLEVKAKQVTLFPILPSISYNFKF